MANSVCLGSSQLRGWGLEDLGHNTVWGDLLVFVPVRGRLIPLRYCTLSGITTGRGIRGTKCPERRYLNSLVEEIRAESRADNVEERISKIHRCLPEMRLARDRIAREGGF